MFDNLPDDVDAQYLSGAAAFVLSGGDTVENVGAKDFAWTLNEIVGLARVPATDEDSRATQKVVDAEEADASDVLRASEYTSNVFEAESRAWAQFALDHADIDV